MFILKTEHFRHTFIFWPQLSCFLPWQMVPFMNQQRWPTRNSHAGQAFRFCPEHSRIFQQGRSFPPACFFIASKKNICRSIWTGTFRQPCSNAWTARMEIPNSWARAFCVFSSSWRVEENSFVSISFPARWAAILFLTGYITTCYKRKDFFSPAQPIDKK